MATINAINSGIPIEISKGGTGTATTPGTNGVIYFDGTKYVGLTNGTTGQVLSANTAAAPSWIAAAAGTVTSVSGTANQINSTGGTTPVLSLSSTITTPGSLVTTSGLTAGNAFTVTTGAITLSPLSTSGIVLNSAAGVISTGATTNHAVVVGNSSGQLTSLTVGTTGLVLIGSSAADPAFGALGVNSGLTVHGLLIGENNSAIAAMSAGSAGQIVTSAGASADPVWTTATYPATTTQGDIIYSSSANVVAGLAKNASASRYLSNTGASNNPAWAQVDLSNGVTGVLPIANGGTFASATPGTNAVMYFDGTRYVGLTNGTTGQILTATTASAPSWGAAGGSGITTLNGDSGSATGSTVTLAGTSLQVTTAASGSTVTISLPSALTAPGSVTATTTLTATAGNITSTNGDVVVGNTAAATTAPFITFKKSRSAGVITSGDVLGEIDFTGIGATTVYVTGASIRSVSSGTIASTRVASNLIFATHPDSTTGVTDRMTIASTGTVTIATPDSGTGLTVSGGGATITAGDFTVTSGNLKLPSTSSTIGNIQWNGATLIHAYGTSNIFIGDGAGNYTLTTATSKFNQGIGTSALAALTTATFNTAIGYQAGKAVTSGSNNVYIGNNVAQVTTTQGDNVCIGDGSGIALTTGTGSNLFIGGSAGGQITTGATNTLIGIACGYNLTGTDGQNIMIGQTRGTAGDNTKTRIGFSTTNAALITSCFVDGIQNATTTGSAVVVNASGQLAPVASSLKYKENVNDMGDYSSAIYKLRPVTFTYKKETCDDQSMQGGLIAEEVLDVMPQLVFHNSFGEVHSVKYQDLSSLLLNEIQKLLKRIEALEAKVGA